MGNWSEEITAKIDSKLESARDKDIIFFRIKEFKRNIERVDEFSTSCPSCKKEMIDIAEVVESIDVAVDVPGRKRREYDRLISRLSSHMRKEHGFYAPYYYSYIYALYGAIAGTALGLLFMKLQPLHKLEMFAIGISIGLVVAYFAGNFKDKKVRNDNKLM
ncbi:hypothetical protein [Maribellus sediminis]|uniref:hypothetical protein n=1 Tax=Maribellus sediminis TaxID=2696285 RepID=UPI00142FA900|nr:hypothetical protein [Maribellus sediminis]